jgi:hypothetical protein
MTGSIEDIVRRRKIDNQRGPEYYAATQYTVDGIDEAITCTAPV